MQGGRAGVSGASRVVRSRQTHLDGRNDAQAFEHSHDTVILYKQDRKAGKEEQGVHLDAKGEAVVSGDTMRACGQTR